MIKILFICHGNICRSTMAQYMMEDMIRKAHAENRFYVDSAATSREEIGNGVHYGTRRKLAEVGIPCGNHKARQMTRRDYDEFDYIIGMDDENMYYISAICGRENAAKYHRLTEFSGQKHEIDDPWYSGDFAKTYIDIKKGCESLLKILKSGKNYIKIVL